MASFGIVGKRCWRLLGLLSRAAFTIVVRQGWSLPVPFVSHSGTTMNADNVESTCRDTFGHEHFDLEKCVAGFHRGCPVRGCTTPLEETRHGTGKIPFCRTHGLRLHANTFVYFNGAGSDFDGRLRNFVIQREAASRVALAKGKKVESHRLGYEMSEDALSWNIFVGVAEAGKLRGAIYVLTGKEVRGDPKLYLWAQLIDIANGSLEAYAPLSEVRRRLEPDIKKFHTEPDVMLVAEGELTVCIEAKFGSGNPIAHNKTVKAGEKPVNSDELVARYYDKAGSRTKQSIVVEGIKGTFHSQLFRNVVFASEMADRGEWHVVNLVSTSQLRDEPKSLAYSFVDPTEQVRAYLSSGLAQNFTYRSWEGLYRELIEPDPDLLSLRSYMKSKSAHFAPAFQGI